MTKFQSYTLTPGELELLEFFESEPVDACPEDGYWCYEYTDKFCVGIRLSFNVLEKSVQTVLRLNGVDIETVVYEGAEELKIEGGELHGVFELGAISRLAIQLKPRVIIRWSSLMK